jgi:hypothetical protein
MKNELREAKYYQLAFKNNLQLTEVDGKVGLLGLNTDQENFYKELEKKEEDYFWSNKARHNEDENGLERHLEETLGEFEYLLEEEDLLGDKLKQEYYDNMLED